MNPVQIVEAILFSSDAPLKAEEIIRADESLNEDLVEEAIDLLRNEYAEAERAFQVVDLAEGYQLLTRPEFATYLERFDTVPRPSRLSGPALETLAIMAYRQPIGRIEVEYIRGVSSAGVIRTLLDRDLVQIVGRGEGIGRPLLYGTTARFLEHFGFRSLEDLPRPEELPIVLREQLPLEEDTSGDVTPEGFEDNLGGEPPAPRGTSDDLGLEVASDDMGPPPPMQGSPPEPPEPPEPATMLTEEASATSPALPEA